MSGWQLIGYGRDTSTCRWVNAGLYMALLGVKWDQGTLIRVAVATVTMKGDWLFHYL